MQGLKKASQAKPSQAKQVESMESLGLVEAPSGAVWCMEGREPEQDWAGEVLGKRKHSTW